MKHPSWLAKNLSILTKVTSDKYYVGLEIEEKYTGMYLLSARLQNQSSAILAESPNKKFLEELLSDICVWNYTKEIDYDIVNHPKHYTTGKIEVADFIADQKLNFFEGNVVKYVARHKHKNGLEDLKKARWYLEYLIKEGEQQCQLSQGKSSET